MKICKKKLKLISKKKMASYRHYTTDAIKLIWFSLIFYVLWIKKSFVFNRTGGCVNYSVFIMYGSDKEKAPHTNNNNYYRCAMDTILKKN